VKRQLLVSVAVLGTAHAGDSRHARLPARLRDETPGLTGDDVESPARHGARRAGSDAGSVAPRASVAGRRRRRQRPSEDDQRAVGPPGTERGVNLQTERPRPPETGGAPEALKRDEWPRAEREVHDVGDVVRAERVARGAGDHPLGVPVERIRRAVAGLGSPVEAIEEGRSARARDQCAGRAGQQLIERERPRRDVERRARQRKKDVEAELAQRARERRQQIVG
jgi:hypothetical protein